MGASAAQCTLQSAFGKLQSAVCVPQSGYHRSMEGVTMTKMFDNLHDSEAFRRLRDAERVARTVFYNAPYLVPGVLQVPAYAEESFLGISGLAASDERATDRVRLRNERHAAFIKRLESHDAPQVNVVIDESVLRRMRAGSDATRKQIEHLIELSRKPNVRIGVVPFELGAHPGLAGNFEVHDSVDGSLAFSEGPFGDDIEDDDERIDAYRQKVGALMSVAVTGDDARALMAKLIGG
ncbi:DUF5753 domain-containing protein [Paractinoplanes brasiliensis]|nr:DUF5753 domain-containing protein [Actinoplanes brasiliensis]